MADDARMPKEPAVPDEFYPELDDETYAALDYDEEAEAALDAEAEADLDAGRFISHEAVMRWVASWGTPDELPPPKVGD